MFSKKFISTFVILSVSIVVLLSFVKSSYVFDKIVNTDITDLNKGRYTSENYDKIDREKYLVLVDEGIESKRIEKNLTQSLKEMDKEIVIKDAKSFKGDLEGYKAIFVNVENLDEVIDIDNIFKSSKEGKTVIFSNRPLESATFNKYKNELGVESQSGVKDAEGMEIITNVLVKGYGIKREHLTENSSLDVKLSKDCTVHMQSKEKIPLLWERQNGQGEIIVANGQFFDDKSNRGVLVGTISEISDTFIYPVINSKVLFLDDFPAPIPAGTSPSIYSKYNMTDDKFFMNIWWPDIVKICNRYNLKPTGYLIYNYQDLTDDLSKINSKKYSENLVTQGRNLLKAGGELGIHGFNHQPLTLKPCEDKSLGYKRWKSLDDMIKAQVALNNFIHNIYPNYKVKGYVPPSNIVSKEGIQALKEGLPSINVISSLFVKGEGEEAYEQEFSYENGMYNFPRYSSGYDYDQMEVWNIYNGITNNGVFTHFIHPDDVLDPARSKGKSWDQLDEEFTELMENVHNNFPWMRADTISGGVGALNEYLKTESKFLINEDGIEGYLKETGKDDYFILRTNKKIESSSGCTYSKIDENIYLIHSNSTEFKLKTRSVS